MNLFKKDKMPERQLATIVTKKEVAVPVTDEILDRYLRTMGIGATLLPNELEVYKEMAKMYNLNPFKREIHVVAYGQGAYRTLAVTVGYEVYLKKAEESGLMEYWDIETAPEDTPIEKYWATLIVKRKDKARHQKWTVHYSEAFQTKKDGKPNKFWVKQPRMMTRKTAMSQGFRLFFEDVLHGIPYTTEEMPDREERDVTPPDPQPVEEKQKPVKKSPPPVQEVMNAEEPSVAQNRPEHVRTPEKEEVAVVETEAPAIDYFKEIIGLVNKTKTLSGSIKAETMGKAMTHKGDQALLKDIFDDLVREING